MHPLEQVQKKLSEEPAGQSTGKRIMISHQVWGGDPATSHHLHCCHFLKLIYFHWRLITFQYCGGFCHAFLLEPPIRIISVASYQPYLPFGPWPLLAFIHTASKVIASKNSSHMIQESQKIHTYVLSSTIYNSQDMEANQMSINRTDEWINKIIHTHTHTHTVEYYSAIKRMKYCHLQQHK